MRKSGGGVVVLDEDEFIENQVRYGYPPEIVRGSRTATDLAVELVKRREEPFGTASDRWIASVDPTTLT